MKASEKENLEARMHLADMYRNGNHFGAFIFMNKASAQGNTLATQYLGDFHYYGIGIDKNKVKGLEHHRKNEADSNAKDNYKLGMEYYYGRDMERCYPIPFAYFQNAADHGHNESQMYLVDVYMNGLV